MTEETNERKPHDLVFGPMNVHRASWLEHWLEGPGIDLSGIYRHVDEYWRANSPEPRKHMGSDLAHVTQIARYLLAELFRVENKLPEEERLERCPMCGHPYWTRPLQGDSMDFEHDFTKRRCRCCSHVRDEPVKNDTGNE